MFEIGDMVCVRSGRGWGNPRKVVELNPIAVNVGAVGNGKWIALTKCRNWNDVQVERANRQKEKLAEKPAFKLLAVLKQDAPMTLEEMKALVPDMSWGTLSGAFVFLRRKHLVKVPRPPQQYRLKATKPLQAI